MLGEQQLPFISETGHFALLVPIERVFVMQQDAEEALFSEARANDFCLQIRVVIVAKAATLKDCQGVFFTT